MVVIIGLSCVDYVSSTQPVVMDQSIGVFTTPVFGASVNGGDGSVFTTKPVGVFTTPVPRG